MIILQVYYDKLPKELRPDFEAKVEEKAAILNKYLHTYPHETILKVNAEKFKNSEFIVETNLFFNSKNFFIKKTARSLKQALEMAFTDLKQNFLQHLEHERQNHHTLSREERSTLLNEAIQDLGVFAQAQDLRAFTDRIVPLLDDLKRYMKRNLKSAKERGIIKEPTSQVNDIVQTTIERAFEQFPSKPDDERLETWIYGLAHTVLDEYLQEERFEDTNFESWEEFADTDLDEVDETLIVEYEFESYVPQKPTDKDIQTTDTGIDVTGIEADVSVNQQSDNEKQVRKVRQALRQLPRKSRSVFDLYTLEGFSVDEVARILDMEEEEVKETITRVKNYLTEAVTKDTNK